MAHFGRSVVRGRDLALLLSVGKNVAFGIVARVPGPHLEICLSALAFAIHMRGPKV